MDFLNLPGLSTGWPSWIITIIFIAAGSWYTINTAKSKAKTAAEEAQKSAETAQKSAIEAMQAEIDVLRTRMEDERKENARKIQSVQRENTRLEHTIDALISALAKRGFIITITGDTIDIEVQDPKKITTVRIQDARNDEDA